jgi:hypothetical protein
MAEGADIPIMTETVASKPPPAAPQDRPQNQVAEDRRIYFSLTPFQMVAASAAIITFLMGATIYLHGKFENVSNEFVDVRKDLRDIDVKLAVNSTKLDGHTNRFNALDDELKHIIEELKFIKNQIAK